MPRGLARALYLALVVFAGLLAYLARVYPLFPGDRELARWVQGLDRDLRPAMAAVSALGDWWLIAVLPLGITLLLVGYRRWREMAFVAGATLPTGLNRAIKLLVNRPRPAVASELSGSFPSGHAVHALAFYGFLFYLATVLVRPLWLKRSLQMLLAGLIVATGLSRVYLGVHWPSDVLGGYLVGAVMLIPLVWAHRRWRR